MTKIQLPFALSAPLDDRLMSRIGDLYGTYGILRVSPDPDRQSLVVQYDATRFSQEDVEAALARAGFPLEIKNRRSR